MISLSRILKPGFLKPSDDVVMIPDADPIPIFDEDGAPEMRGMLRDEVYESILRQAREEGETLSGRIVERTRSECADLLEQARRDAEEIRDQAQREGFQHGVREKAGEIGRCIQDVVSCINELREEHRRFTDTYAGELKNFAAEIAQQVLLEKIETDEMTLVKLVRQAVHSIRDADWISVEVSERLPGLVRHLETEFAKKETETRLEVSGEDLPVDSCILQTPEGVIDASVSTQIENLKQLFADMDRMSEDGD